MTSSSPSFDRRRTVAAGFTIVELMVAAGLSGLILTGVLSANLHMLRSGLRMSNYTEIDSQVHRAFDQFGRDAKQAVDLKWNSSSDITFTIPASDTTMKQVTYAWSSANGTFYRVPGADSSAQTGRAVLVSGIPATIQGAAGFAFSRFDGNGTAATTDGATRLLTVKLSVTRSAGMMAATTETGISATFALRNKASF